MHSCMHSFMRSRETFCVASAFAFSAVDAVLGSECPLCGFLMVRSIHQPLIDVTDVEAVAAWRIRETDPVQPAFAPPL